MEAMLFLLGFASITTVYEIAKTGRKTKSEKLTKSADSYSKKLK